MTQSEKWDKAQYAREEAALETSKVVPREPTQAMIEAALDAPKPVEFYGHYRMAWIAMYDAAPSAPAQEREQALLANNTGLVERTQMMFNAKNVWADRARSAESALAAAQKDAEYGKILMRYIDRLIHPSADDPIERIVYELDCEVDAEMVRQRAALGAK